MPNKQHDLNNINIPLVLSYENDNSNKYAIMFKKTLEKNGWQHRFIGGGTKWTGFNNKVLGYHNFLTKLQEIPDDKIVILSDSRDVFCLRTSDLFIDKVKKITDKQLIISSELFLLGKMDWSEEEISAETCKNPNFFWQGEPMNQYWNFHGKGNNIPERKYINTGLIVGKSLLVKNALNWILDNNISDDQLGFSRYANKYPELVYIDFDAKIIHTSTCFVNGSLYDHNIQIKDSPSFIELFGLSSYFLHIPGINISKGQKCIYNAIYNLFDADLLKNIFDVYNVKNR